jgi:1,4-dihydroxy-2-naphthoate octaprenyltransferase
MSSAKVWVSGARPKTLPAAIAPVLVASAYASDQFSLIKALAALVVAVSLQIAVNYANDYSDGIRGTDNDRVGPLRLVASGLKSPASVKRAAYISFLIAMIAGTYLALTTTYWLFGIGVVAIIAAWKYTGGKSPYGYLGLGELSVFIFFGLVATIGTFYVQTEEIDSGIFLIGSAMGAIACGILLLNNIRDIETDKVSEKRTLSVRIGERRSIQLYWLLITAALILFFLVTKLPFTLLVLAISPLLIKLYRAITSRRWIKALEMTGKVQLLYAMLLALASYLSLR